jgi:uncharacterized protein (TIGR02611 family)
MTLPEPGTRSKHERFRGWMLDQHPMVRHAYRVGLAVFGSLVIIIGLLLVPLPGPGWLVVFFGVALLGLEFPLFHRLHEWVKGKALRFWGWLKKKFPVLQR